MIQDILFSGLLFFLRFFAALREENVFSCLTVRYNVLSHQSYKRWLLNKFCGSCKFGYDTKPGGQSPSPGTVWCGKRSIQMARSREMPCFIPLKKMRHCSECKRAKITTPSGGALQLGNIWCDKKRTEVHKMRSMDCFE